MRLDENFNYVDSLEQALEETRKAYRLAMHAGDKSLLSYTSQDMSNVFNDLGEKDSCLYYARQAYEQTDTDRFSCLLTLASAYISTDAAKQAFALLRQAIPKTAEDRYSVFHMQSQAATGASNFKLSKALGDSANRCLQEMYRTASQAKMTYYSSLLKKESERAKMQGKAEMQQWVFGLTVPLCLAIVSFIAYAYWTYRKRTQIHLIHEQEMYSLKREMTEKQHQEELTHKNVQLTVMRGYLQKKIEIVERLYSIVPAKGKHVVLSENDWAELETFLNCVEDLFVSRLKQRHPNLTKSDLHLMMLLRLKIP